MSVGAGTELPGWIRDLADARPFGPGDARGTLNLIDDAARLRAVSSIRSGRTVSLCRPLADGDINARPGRPGFEHIVEYAEAGGELAGMGWGLDHLVLDPHGMRNTHLDALNHVAVGGTFYGGRPVSQPEQGSIDVLAPHGVVARAVYVDVPASRGTAWADHPVTGDDLDRALAEAGVAFEPGDALCVDMGRDRFEGARGHVLGGPETDEDAGGGLGSDGARWVAEHGASLLAWDMLDSREAKATRASAHVLTWAIGLLLVDNCDFAALRAELGGGTQVAGAIVLAPLPIPGANGANVNPIVIR